MDPVSQSSTPSPAGDYSQFLSLDKLLALQEPQWLGKHDEVMFMVVHQVSELWIKLAIHELTYLKELISRDALADTEPVFVRIQRIQAQLLHSWDVTVTLQPVKYLEFREAKRFQGSSGLQSYQYRMLEFILGHKSEQMIEPHRTKPAVYEQMRDVLSKPSLYDDCLALLARRGFAIPPQLLDRDWRRPYMPNAEVEQVWFEVYQQYQRYWDLYQFAERLVDIEYRFQQWRFTHMKTVERIIGYRRGTGGTAGVGYLVKALDITFFPELWSVRTKLGSQPEP
jgi:tryptophan 2,3-dioxygenase